MVKAPLKPKSAKIRFLVVGSLNTFIDFALLFILTGIGVPRIASNMISTGIAFIFSFFANRTYTFDAKNGAVKRQMTMFLIVTLFGLWVIQPIIIELTVLLAGSNEAQTLMAGKLIATAVTLVWNYVLYNKVVYNNKFDLKEVLNKKSNGKNS